MIAAIGRSLPAPAPRSSTPPGWSRCPAWSTCTPTCASRAGRTPRPSRPAPGPRRSAATPRCTRWPTPTRSPTPPAWSSRSGGSAGRPGWSTSSRSARSPSGSSGERLAELGAMADSAARVRVFSDDGHCVADPALMRRALEYVKAFDGVVAQHAEEPRLTAGAQMHEGDGLRPARADRLAGRRRGGDHRPGRAARRPRRLPAARLPRLDRRLGGDPALGQGARRPGDRRGDPAPPAAHRRAARRPTTRCSRSTRRCGPAEDVAALRAGLADGTIDAVATDHAPHALEDKESEWAAGPARHARAGDRRCPSSVLTMVETGLLDWRGRGRADVGGAGPASAGSPTTAGRWPRASRPTWCWSTRRARWTVDPAALGQPQPQHPYAGRELPGRVVATFLRGEPTVLDGKAPMRRRASEHRRAPAPRSGASRSRAWRAILVLEDGRTFRGEAYGAVGDDGRRGGLRHRDDRLPGDADRPVATTGRWW